MAQRSQIPDTVPFLHACACFLVMVPFLQPAPEPQARAWSSAASVRRSQPRGSQPGQGSSSRTREASSVRLGPLSFAKRQSVARGGVSAGEVTSKTFFLPPGRKPSWSKDVYVTETGGRSGSPTPPRQGGKRVVDLIEAKDKEEADADIAEIRRQHQHRRKRRIAGMMQGIFDEVEGLTREQRREVCGMPPPPQSKRSLGP